LVNLDLPAVGNGREIGLVASVLYRFGLVNHKANFRMGSAGNVCNQGDPYGAAHNNSFSA